MGLDSPGPMPLALLSW